MARYEIEISRSAERQLRKMPRSDRGHIVGAMLELADNPFPRGSRKLAGYDDVYRVRTGRYRILYSVAQRTLVIVVLKVGHRKEVYR